MAALLCLSPARLPRPPPFRVPSAAARGPTREGRQLGYSWFRPAAGSLMLRHRRPPIQTLAAPAAATGGTVGWNGMEHSHGWNSWRNMRWPQAPSAQRRPARLGLLHFLPWKSQVCWLEYDNYSSWPRAPPSDLLPRVNTQGRGSCLTIAAQPNDSKQNPFCLHSSISILSVTHAARSSM